MRPLLAAQAAAVPVAPAASRYTGGYTGTHIVYPIMIKVGESDKISDLPIFYLFQLFTFYARLGKNSLEVFHMVNYHIICR
jgi:hypothetical protein